MKLFKLSIIGALFSYHEQAKPDYLKDTIGNAEAGPQALNEIINRRGKSFTQRLVIPPSLMRDISEKERKAVILDELSVHEQVARQLAMQMTDDDFKVMGAGND
ncbi:hypothetical protein [Pseudoalteromonas sp. TB41]|jgi:hypothetical protein|uniref:hypothetical protein n=1 Tax=Pseudoalteromonas sp. TB41 TaxID=985149 RepID=UPI00041109EA|nr:hypothetical protein [Pseudoalteromonas sp. TB41]